MKIMSSPKFLKQILTQGNDRTNIKRYKELT
jgi:hypothetical protein